MHSLFFPILFFYDFLFSQKEVWDTILRLSYGPALEIPLGFPQKKSYQTTDWMLE